MFYVYEFSAAANDYRWVGAYSEREAAAAHVQKLKHRGSPSCGIAEMDWDSFVECATRQRLGKIADALVKLKLLPDPAALRDDPCYPVELPTSPRRDFEPFPSRAMK